MRREFCSLLGWVKQKQSAKWNYIGIVLKTFSNAAPTNAELFAGYNSIIIIVSLSNLHKVLDSDSPRGPSLDANVNS